MKVETYIINTLKTYGVTDTFGIPGGVVLKLLKEMEAHSPVFKPHLCYHEQSAGFAACGYAQAKGTLGVAYGTRGPGILNMVTCIAEAYQESLPVLFITAHGNRSISQARFDQNQEIDVVSAVKGFTKYAENIETLDEVESKLTTACQLATTGRKGPVLLDFASALWGKEIDANGMPQGMSKPEVRIDEIISNLQGAKCPVLLIGDGIRHSIKKRKLLELAEKIKIPVLSSRGAQDLLAGSPYYFGYVGSHGIRYANFILSKADVIIALGNRLAFPIGSASFSPILEKTKIVRVDIDPNELSRSIPGSVTLCADAGNVIEKMAESTQIPSYPKWVSVCLELKEALVDFDCTEPVQKLADYIQKQPEDTVYVCDVGNNEFWFSRAFERIQPGGTVLCSKSFGTLGSSLGKAIGAYYATGKPVTCVMGDQGFQYHVQELQFIGKYSLPISIVVVNNRVSGMIMDHEARVLGETQIHVTEESGYFPLNLRAIADAYGIKYSLEHYEEPPVLHEISVPPIPLIPNLPRGNACQNMEPLLDRSFYETLNHKQGE